MRGKTPRRVAALALASLGLLAACSAQPAPTHITVLEPLPLQGPVLTLGAGDALGRAVFISDIILAAGMHRDETPVIVDVPVPFEFEDEAR